MPDDNSLEHTRCGGGHLHNSHMYCGRNEILYPIFSRVSSLSARLLSSPAIRPVMDVPSAALPCRGLLILRSLYWSHTRPCSCKESRRSVLSGRQFCLFISSIYPHEICPIRTLFPGMAGRGGWRTRRDRCSSCAPE